MFDLDVIDNRAGGGFAERDFAGCRALASGSGNASSKVCSVRISTVAVLSAPGLSARSDPSVSGSHHKLRHEDGRTVIVPHPKKDLPTGTARAIAKQAGWLED